MDRISYLPQSILHDILSRLPDEDAARTSVLSKAWHDTRSTFPCLIFDESRYEITKIPNDADNQLQMTALLLDQLKFSELVLGTLFRFRCKGLTIRKFKLVLKPLTPSTMLSRVYNWMKLVCDSGVEVLQLDNGVEVLRLENPRSSDSHGYFTCLPLCVLEAKSLIKLELSWDLTVDKAFLNHPIQFSSLQVLSLKYVFLGYEQVIQNLIFSCPLIEKLELVHCTGLTSVSIYDLPRLKVVFIVGMEEVDVDAPSLEDLFFDASGFRIASLPKINMDKCTNLRELCLVCVTSIFITDQWFIELFQKFPLLEKLVLEGFYMSDVINISSIQLKVLDLGNCYYLEEIEIDAPNLYECRYNGDGNIIPIISILNSSSQLVLDVVFFVDSLMDLENLRSFLKCITPKHIPVSLFLRFCEGSTVEFNILQDTMVPPSIKHLMLCADLDTEEGSLLLVTSLFWSCRPFIVSFNLDLNQTLVKIFCEKLIRRKEDGCCCNSSQIKCWWHFLKDVKVSSSFRNYNVVDDFKTLLESFSTLSSEEEEEVSRYKEGHIKFWLEWQL